MLVCTCVKGYTPQHEESKDTDGLLVEGPYVAWMSLSKRLVCMYDLSHWSLVVCRLILSSKVYNRGDGLIKRRPFLRSEKSWPLWSEIGRVPRPRYIDMSIYIDVSKAVSMYIRKVLYRTRINCPPPPHLQPHPR